MASSVAEGYTVPPLASFQSSVSKLAVSATVYWPPRGFGRDRLAFPGRFAGTARQLCRAGCRLGHRLLASPVLLLAPAGALRSHRQFTNGSFCLRAGVHMLQTHSDGMLRSYHL